MEFQTVNPELRGSHMQQHGRCRDNQNQQQNIFSSTPFCSNLMLLHSSSNLHDSCFTNSMLSGERGFLELLRDTTKNIQTFNGTNLARKELAMWLTKWDSLFEAAEGEDQLNRVFKALMLKAEGALWEVVNKCRTRTMGTTDSTIMVNTEVKEKKAKWGDPCPVHGTSRHLWDECRLKNSTSCPYCQEGIKEGMLNKHVSICKGKCCYECGCLRHMRVEYGVKSSGKRRRESDRSLDR